MDMNRERMLHEVMAADFTLYDLALYLDTHPTDQRALALYCAGVQRATMVRNAFEGAYGPLSARSSLNPNVWQWIESPWPWERQ